MSIEHEESMSDLVKWFENAKLADQPFQLISWENITNPSAYYEALHRDIAAGSNSPRARYDVLKSDLQRLKAFCEQ